jgi:hypothetical protein
VWWEQQGSGITSSANIPLESMTLEQMISDIGTQAAARAPELYYAYIGQAQISNQLKS